MSVSSGLPTSVSVEVQAHRDRYDSRRGVPTWKMGEPMELGTFLCREEETESQRLPGAKPDTNSLQPRTRRTCLEGAAATRGLVNLELETFQEKLRIVIF